MIDGSNREMILKVAFSLLVFSLLEQGVNGQCTTPPKNLAVYDGTPNTAMTCSSPTKVSWTLKPTTDELSTYKITNYDDIVTPTLTNLFGVNSASLNIKTAQSNATIPQISTAGLYIILINGSATKFGAKLTVVRAPPTCNCTATNSTKINITCSLTYTDSVYHPVAAKMTWTSNGNFFRNDTPVKRYVYPYNVSTSVITVDAYDPANYQCTVTFTKPTNIQFAYVATNEPAFSATCTPTCPRCLLNLKNIAVYEGQLNTLMNLTTDSQNVSWKVIPTSDESTTYTIINFVGYRDQSLTNLYDVNKTALIIKKATTTENGNPITTAGLYIGQCANYTNNTGAKLLVVRTGPLCSCISINSTSSNVSCKVTFADSSYHPILPIVTWKLNGTFLATYTLPRKRIDAYVFYAESTITSNGGSPETYTCELTFAAPTGIQIPWVALNAPNFNATCTVTGCGR